MAIERLHPDDMSWTGHSLHAHQCQYDMLRQNSYHNANCPLDPCRTRTPNYPAPVGFEAPKSTNIFPPVGETMRRAKQERQAEQHRVDSIRSESIDAVLRSRSAQGLNDTSLQGQHVQGSTMSSAIKAESKEISRTIKDEYKEAKHIVQDTYHEARDIERLAIEEPARQLLHNSDNVNRAVESTVQTMIAPHKTMVGSTALAAASLVATVATVNLAALKSDIYVADCRALGKDLAFTEGIERITTAVHTATSFGSYMSAVQEAKPYERLAIQDAEVARDRKIADADSKIQAANTRYDNQVAMYTTTRDREADKYARNMRDLDARQAAIENSTGIQQINTRRQEQLDNAAKTYSTKSAAIEADKQRALAKIDPNTPIAAAQRREIAAPYEKRQETLDRNYKRDVENIGKKFDAQIAHKTQGASEKLADIANTRALLTQKHNAAQETFKQQVAGAKAERDTTVRAAKIDASKAQKEFKESKPAIKEAAKKRTEDVKNILTGNYQEARTAKQNYAAAKYTIFHGGDGALKMKTALAANQMQLSEFMVRNFGSAEEKQIVEAYFADKEKNAAAQKMGFATASTLSKDDRKKAEEILMQYGYSDMSSGKSIQNAIDVLRTQLPALKTLAAEKQAIFTEKAQAVDTLKAERKSLIANAGGKDNLSPADQKKLAALDEKLKAAKKEMAVAKNEANKSKAAVRTANSQLRQMARFKEALPHMGKNIKQKLSTYVKQNYKAAAKLSMSLGGALIALNRMTTQYMRQDTISQADARFKGQVNQILKYTNFATKSITRTAAIGLGATKMVLGLGKLSTRTLKIITTKSPLYKAVKEGLLSFAKNHSKFAALMRGTTAMNKGVRWVGSGVGKLGGKGIKIGKKLGKTVLKAPGTVLKIASTSIQDLPDMAAKAALGAFVHAGVGTASLLARGTIKAGVKIARAPVRVVAKGGKAALKGGGKLLKKGAGAVFNKTIGRTKLWGKAQQLGQTVKRGLKTAKAAVGNILKKIGKPFQKIGGFFGKIFAAIGGFFSSLIGVVVGIISVVLQALLCGVIALGLLITVIVMMMSVLDAIFQFFAEMTVGYQIKIKNDPSFIMNLGANYRNVELSIVEFFSEEGGYTNSDEYSNKIEVNDDPLYYAVFNNSFEWFGWCDDLLTGLFNIPAKQNGKDVNYRTSDGTRKVNQAAKDLYPNFLNAIKTETGYVNNSLKTEKTLLESLQSAAKQIWDALKTAFGGNSTFGDPNIDAHEFKAFVQTYDAVNATYWMGAKGDPYKEKSDYEVSNAKDVMAMMDAIYTMDDEMTRTKALRYLGVGEYQLSSVEINDKNTKVHKSSSLDNLFWKTHEIEYTQGTSADDIYFHPSDTNGQINTISITNPNDKRYPLRQTLNAACDNYSSIEVKYKRKPHADGTCYTEHPAQWVWDEIDDANMQRHPRNEYIDWKYVTSWTAYNSSHGQNETRTQYRCLTYHTGYGYCYITVWGSGDAWGYADIRDHDVRYKTNYYKTKNTTCPHDPEEKTKEFKYCLGHIALSTDIYVSVSDPPKSTSTPNLFTKTQELETKNIKIGNGIWTWSKDLDITAFGGLDPETINPNDEWSDSSLVSLAQGKAQEPLEYFSEEDAEITQMKTKHGENTGAQYLIVEHGNDRRLFHVLYFRNNIFYQPDLITGEQKDMDVYNKQWVRKKLSMKKSNSGVTYVKFTASTS